MAEHSALGDARNRAPL